MISVGVEAQLPAQEGPSTANRPAVETTEGRTSTLQCLVKGAKCREQGKLFTSAYSLRYHYAKHAKTALINRLKQSRTGLTSPTAPTPASSARLYSRAGTFWRATLAQNTEKLT